MRALIDPEVFSSPAVSPVDLLSLFRFAAEGRHSVLPDPLEAPEIHAWLARRDREVRDEYRFALESSLDIEKRHPPSVEIRVTVASAPRWLERAELPFETALRFLASPLAIKVESARSDRAFLLAVADRHQRRALRDAESQGWIQFEHGGGLSEMYESLRESRSKPEILRRGYWCFDSDALAPSRPSPSSESLRRLCQKLRVRFHQLQRRAAENYLPVPALEEVWARQKNRRERTKKVRAFAKLAAAQRHHFNMKSGFAGDRELISEYKNKTTTAKIARDAERLYESLDDGSHKVLKSAFGSRVRDLFRQDRVLKEQVWFEQEGLRVETRPLIEAMLACR